MSARGTAWTSYRGAGNPVGGTGGLLIVYGMDLKGSGQFTSQGSPGTGGSGANNQGWRYNFYGGSSGGGSINLFFADNCEVEISSQTNVSSIAAPSSGLGGSGTVNITQK